MAMNRDKRRSNNEAGADDALKEVVVFVNRCAKTVKGGRRMSFSAVVVVGNPDEHQVGVGFGIESVEASGFEVSDDRWLELHSDVFAIIAMQK